ncbi:MAG: SRPBCC domain-containing protein [Actinomycetota bacterium]
MELTNEFRVALPVERAWAVLTDVERIAPCMPGAQLQEIEGDEYRGVVKIKVGPITAQYKGQATFLEQDETRHVAVLRAEGRETRGQGNASATITATLAPEGDGTAVSVVTDLTVTGRVAQFGRGVLADVSAKLLDQFVDCLEKTVLADDRAPASAPREGALDQPQPAEPVEPAAETPAPETPAPVAAKRAPAKRPATKRAEPLRAAGTGSTAPDADPSPAAAQPAEPEAPAPAATASPAPVIQPEPTPATPAQPVAQPATAPSGVRRVDHPPAQPVDLISAAGSPVAKRVGPVLAVIAVLWLLKRLFGRRRK